MTSRPFLDTNILVYATLVDRSAGAEQRSERAEEILAGGGLVSVQVLNEFVDLARRKFQRDWESTVELLAITEELCGPPEPLTAAVQKRAVALAARWKLRIYDATIMASAIEAGCTRLLSEDLQHGQEIEGVRVENPFR